MHPLAAGLTDLAEVGAGTGRCLDAHLLAELALGGGQRLLVGVVLALTTLQARSRWAHSGPPIRATKTSVRSPS
ncbi:hypothetical protein [Janibacter melonis]|uniref:hypothetical protein n=1 Tax=Janibacter melonis TaxID=262209 RepID=UPI0027DA7E3A|nr:hypothetical protein [Janibacter melonis]